MKSKVLGVIPARFGSTRFPGKPLAKIGTRTMIEWTYLHSFASRKTDLLVVATDDERIAEAVRSFKGNVVMTSNSHPTGTDRILEVISKNDYKDYDIIVNIQGDEPGIDVGLIDGVTELKLRHRDWEMSTACCRIWDKNELSDPNRVKVAFTKQGKALYFSRSLIPSNFKEEVPVYRHLGIYCYEKEFLLNYSSLPESSLEKSESLEQLRALENGNSIGVFKADHAGLSVDSPSDLETVAADFRKRGLIA